MSSLPISQMIEVEFLTATQSITAQVASGGRRLSDILNDPRDNYVDLSGVRMVRLDHLQEATATSEFARLSKQFLLVALPREREVPADEVKKPLLEYVLKERHPIVVSLPPFLISGSLHIVKGADFLQVRIEALPSFLPLSNPVVLYEPDPQKRWSDLVAIINRSKVEILFPSKEPNL